MLFFIFFRQTPSPVSAAPVALDETAEAMIVEPIYSSYTVLVVSNIYRNFLAADYTEHFRKK